MLASSSWVDGRARRCGFWSMLRHVLVLKAKVVKHTMTALWQPAPVEQIVSIVDLSADMRQKVFVLEGRHWVDLNSLWALGIK
jgi:hypothetical protein